MKKNLLVTCALLLCCFFIIADKVKAQPQLTFTPLISNVPSAVDIKNAGDGTNRLFIVQQTGTVRIYKNGALLTKPFLNVKRLIKNGSEQGLLSIAFPPGFKTSGYFFIYYTATNANVTLARYKVSAGNPDVADPASGVVLFSYPKPGGFNNHNGGALQFGRDGMLYVTIGDGGSGGDPFNNAQNLASPFGKMHRLDVRLLTAPYYKIPLDNPFVNNATAVKTIWAYGLRNTWRWSFDRQTGDTWLADVGQDLWEEVDYAASAKGLNFGWRCYEGNNTYNLDSCNLPGNYTFPILAYPHNTTSGGFSVTGGYVYRGAAVPALRGYYICADYISANAWKIISNGSGGWNISQQKNVPSSIVSFGEDESGEMYAASLNGIIYRVGAQAAVATNASGIATGNVITYNHVYPTVITNNSITLAMKDAFKSVRVLDMNGKQVFTQNLINQAGVVQLTLPALAKGLYVLELVGNKTERFKIIVQ